MKRVLLIAVPLLLVLPKSRAGSFEVPCPSPFHAIEQHHPIDDDCDNSGNIDPAKLQGRALQNQAKNNLCAKGKPVVLTINDFIQLQDNSADIKTGDNNLPDDRSTLAHRLTKQGKSIGEGTVVQLVAHVVEAHYTGKESVNCGDTGKENIDVHIALGESESSDVCDSVTAEVIPHHRPDAWTRFADSRSGANDAPVTIRRLVRITGQLFLDATHSVACHQRGQPSRCSCWEIHPVYQIEVCNSASGTCNDWVPLDKWLGTPGEEESDN